MGFRSQPIQPVYPQANGLVENFNKILQKIMIIAKVERNNWKRGMYTFLRNYRTTPHSTTGVTPAELMFQTRSFRTRLPEFSQIPSDESVRETDRKNKEKCKQYAERRRNVQLCDIKVGDLVLVKIRRRTKACPVYNPVPYTVVGKKGNMITARCRNHTKLFFFQKGIY